MISSIFGFDIVSEACCLIRFVFLKRCWKLGIVGTAKRGKSICALKTICRGVLTGFVAFARTS